MEEIASALGGFGCPLPRRAIVLEDGTVGDKTLRPQAVEVVTVSLACEALKRQTGLPVYPRSTRALLDVCLRLNDRGAWGALLDDLRTHDVDMAELREVMRDSECTLAECIVTATPGQHFWTVVKVTRLVAKELDECTVLRMGLAFQRLFVQVLHAVNARPRDVSVDERAQCVTDLGKLIVWCQVPAHVLAEHLELCRGMGDDVLLLFLFAPLEEVYEHAPATIDFLVERLCRNQLYQKYPPCALLALAPPRFLEPHAGALQQACADMLNTAAAQGSIDPKLALACASVARSITEPRSLPFALANALKCMSAAVIQHKTV